MRILLILGTPRAGTSWVAKTFDSHQDVIYRHEPDDVFPNASIPIFCAPADYPHYAEEAARYLTRLADVRTTKTVGTPPIFRKAYRSPLLHFLHLASIFAYRLPELSGRGAALMRELQLPEFANQGALRSALHVIKSVSLLDRAGLFTRAVAGIRTILIIRDPFGFIASQVRGRQLKKFSNVDTPTYIADTEFARRLGLTVAAFGAMDLAEQLAWEWRLYNDKALEDLAGCSNAKIVLLRDMAMDAERIAKELFAFAGLSWGEDTARFLRDSQNATGPNRYYSVRRSADFRERMDSWEGVLTAEEAERVRSIVEGSSAGRLIARSQSPGKTVPIAAQP